MSATCPICQGQRWVCERHTDKPWFADEGGCRHRNCGAPGVPCSCNAQAEMPPQTLIIASNDDVSRN